MRFYLCKRIACCSSLAVGLAFPAATSAGEASQVQEIVVTAMHRDTELESTPASISAFTEEALRRDQIDDFRDLALRTPGLEVGGYAGLGTNPVAIRGIGQNPLGVGSDDSVAVYLDGVYLGRAYSDLFDFADTERVEILRGPQGTLWGRNATGGAINIISHEPSNEVTGGAMLRLGTLGEVLGRSFIAGPVADDRVLAKLAVSRHHIDGFVTNRFDGSKSLGQNQTNLKASLVLKPADHLSITLAGDISRFLLGADSKRLTEANRSLDSVDDNIDGFEKRRNEGISATIDGELGFARLTSILAYRRAAFDSRLDGDGTAADLFRNDPVLERQFQFSEEVRLASTGGGAWNWLGGVSFFQEHARSFAFLPLQMPAGLASVTLAARNETASYAAFADVTYRASDRLDLTIGGRYSYERKHFVFDQTGGGSVPRFATLPELASALANGAFTPRFVADYHWNADVMTYASVTRGFKSGGFSGYDLMPVGTTSKPGFGPEDLWAYEIGLKSTLFGRLLRLNMSAFHYDFSDLQVRVADSLGFASVRNAAAASVNGAEIEAEVKPTPEAVLGLSFAGLDARYSRFSYVIGDQTVDNSGKFLLRAPKWKGNISGQYRINLDAYGALTPRVEYAFESRSFYLDTNDFVYSHGWTNIVNFRLSYEPPREAWSFTFYARNLSDQRYVANAVPILGQPLGVGNQPRTFGIELRVDW